MRKHVFILMAVVAVLATGCDFGDEGNFWAQNYVTEAYYKLNADLLAENSRCEVWAERGSGVTEATAKNIANEYLNKIYPRMMNTFGYKINDSDLGIVDTMQIAHYIATGKTSGAKLTILLLDINDGYKKTEDPYVAGYFTPYNLFDYDKSNKREMIYMDTYPADPTSPASYETLAHEMQHLMNFVSSIVFRANSENLNLMETWVDEGLAGAAQWVYSQEYNAGRLNHYIKDPSKLIARGNNFYIWDNYKDNPYANLDDYATVYLFFQYLRLQSSAPTNDPTKIYREIIISNHPDYRAVVGADTINSAHKNNWSILLRDWFAANYIKDSSSLYGYKGQINITNTPMFPTTATSVNLFPGEGVYSKINSSDTVPSNSNPINYAGLNSTGNPVTSGSASGARLTYNVDTTTKNYSSASGSTTGVAASVQITDSKQFTGSFQVDASYFLKNRNGLSDEIRSAFSNSYGRSIGNGIFKFDRSKVERVFINE
jgi:large repetitive protein